MTDINKIKRQGLNFSTFINLEKAGVYVENAKNNKLGRTGQPYKKSDAVKTNNNTKKGSEGGGEKSANDIVNVLENSTTLKNANTKQLDHIIDFAGFNIDKGADDNTKKEAIAKEYIKSAELEGDLNEVANSLDEIVEEALQDSPDSNIAKGVDKYSKLVENSGISDIADEQLDTVIKYNKFDISPNASPNTKRMRLAQEYAKKNNTNLDNSDSRREFNNAVNKDLISLFG